MKKHHITLELNKIFDMLKEEIRLEDNLLLLDNVELSNDLDEINKLLDETDEASRIIQRMGRFEILFKTNVNYILTKAFKGLSLSIEEILEIGKLLDTVKNLIIYNQSLSNAHIDNLLFNAYVSNLIYPKNLNLRIKQVINNFGEILDDASVTLKSIRKQISDSEKSISTKLNEIISKNASKLTQTIVTMRNERYVIPVKNDFKNAIKGFIHDISSSGETVFIEPIAIFEINNKINNLKEEEKKEIARILLELTQQILEHKEEIEISYEILLSLDMIFSKAALSLKLNGVKPKINDIGNICLLNTYHPLLNVPNIVKNNIIINKDTKGIIITGPNTGGKTVILKTIGLLSLMVKYGLLIPCGDGSEIMIFNDVYSDIGDEQSISQNLSTFSSHMKNVIEIMNSVNDKSLVLLDELGSGTDPAEGASLAISIFDYLISKNCLVITSSHYAELKLHAFESNNIINASVEFDINTLNPTYKLLIGVPGESNALKISRILGLNEEIVKNAEKLTKSNTNEISSVLEKLTRTSNDLEKKLNEIRNKEYLLNKKLDEIDNLKEKTNKERNEIIRNANFEADKIIKNKEKEIKQLIDELKELKTKSVKSHEVSDLVHKFNELKSDEAPISKAFNVDSINIKKEIEVGDNVYIDKFNAYGEVVKINKNKYEIQIGNATITCLKEEIELTKAKEVNKKPIITPKKDIVITQRKNVSPRLDLRGMRFEDAEPLIDDYIQDAHYAGLNSVSIIHGFGTGVIRELVQKKLRGHRLVKSYRYGGQNEGGMGATIVEFK